MQCNICGKLVYQFAHKIKKGKTMSNLMEQYLEQKASIMPPDRDVMEELIEQLQQRNDELAATVERLRVNGAKVCLEFPDKITRIQKEFMLTVSPYGYSGQANLNHVKREAFIEGAKFAESMQAFDYDVGAEVTIKIEANTKYPSGKDGE